MTPRARTLAAFVLGLLLLLPGPAAAHEVRPAYLELRQTAPDTWEVLFKVPALGDDRRLGLHLGLPESCAPLVPPRATVIRGAVVERHTLRGLAGGTVRVDGLASTVIDVLVRVEPLDGPARVDRLTPDRNTFVVASPGEAATHVAGTYLELGVEHILLGVDHLLFVLALVLLVKGWKRLVGTLTAFTLAHSLTLGAATLGWVQVPVPPVEAVIALSILFVACEIVHGHQGRPGWTARRPWTVAFAFGLLHGLGFASALREVGLPPGDVPLALLFFNVGVEAGQLLFVACVTALIALLARALHRFLLPPAAWELPAAYGIGAVSAFWVLERTASFLGA